MAVTILERPLGHVISSTVRQSDGGDASGDLVCSNLAHGMTTGNYVYVTSLVAEYNGFWYVTVLSSTDFFISPSAASQRVQFIVAATINWQVSVKDHVWSAVHLPITYRLSNDKYPVNSVDSARTITGLTNYQGFAQLSLSGSLGTFEDLSFVKISNASDSDLDGVYQVVDKLSTSSVILNIDYTTINGAGILGATIQLYYGNYNVVVQVYAGLNASHEHASLKPYELAATLELIPDDNNEVFFSINDILKAYIRTENNLLQPSLPNNLDFWTNFYISTSEQYDTSNGYSVTTLESSFTSDQSNFEGFAVNAKLEFKNIYSGYLSEYLMTSTAGKFLTLFTIPVLFCCGDDTPDCYQDISFLCPSVDIGFDLMTDYPLSGWTNEGVPLTIPWTTGAVPFVTMGDGDTSDRLSESGITGLPAGTYTLTYNITSAVAGVNFMSVQIRFKKAGVAVSSPNPVTISLATGSNISSTSVTLTDVIDEVEVTVIDPGGAGVNTTTLNSLNIHVPDLVAQVEAVKKEWYLNGSLSLTETDPITNNDEGVYRYQIQPNTSYDRVDLTLLDGSSVPISETKQFEIDCGCADQEIRLTWLNNLGGFDYWAFNTQSEHAVDITQAIETKKNIFPTWPNSYGEFADTVRKQTSRTSMVKKFLVTQNLTQDQADAIAFIKSSPLVQIINSRYDKRTVIVDADSFVKYTDGDKLINISFNINYTDDIPSQTV